MRPTAMVLVVCACTTGSTLDLTGDTADSTPSGWNDDTGDSGGGDTGTDTGDTGGDSGDSGGDTGDSGGDSGDSGGDSGDSGSAVTDGDQDGHLAPADCDDGDPLVHPGAHEFCGVVERDCDGGTPAVAMLEASLEASLLDALDTFAPEPQDLDVGGIWAMYDLQVVASSWQVEVTIDDVGIHVDIDASINVNSNQAPYYVELGLLGCEGDGWSLGWRWNVTATYALTGGGTEPELLTLGAVKATSVATPTFQGACSAYISTVFSGMASTWGTGLIAPEVRTTLEAAFTPALQATCGEP